MNLGAESKEKPKREAFRVDELFEDIVKETKMLRDTIRHLNAEKDADSTALIDAHREIRSLTQEIRLLEKQKNFYERQCSQNDAVVRGIRETHEKERLSLENTISKQKEVFQKMLKAKEKVSEDIFRKSALFSAFPADAQASKIEDSSAASKKIGLLESTLRTLIAEKKALSTEISRLEKVAETKEAEASKLRSTVRCLEIENESLEKSNSELAEMIDELRERSNAEKLEVGVQTDLLDNAEKKLLDSLKAKELEQLNSRLTEKLEAMVVREMEMQTRFEELRFKAKLQEKLLKEREGKKS